MVPEPAPPRRAAELLRGLCGGAVHLPGDPAYDEARMPWNLQADSYPAAVAYPAFPHEVSDGAPRGGVRRPQGRTPGHRSRRPAALRPPRRRRPAADLGHDRAARRRRGTQRAGRRRGALG